MIRNDEFTETPRGPAPLPEPTPPLSPSAIDALIGEARAIEGELGRLEAAKAAELGALVREAARLRPEVLRESRAKIEERILAAADAHADAAGRLSGASAAQARYATPEATLASAEFRDGASELAFARRAERASQEGLLALAAAAFHAGNTARLRVLVEEVEHRGDRFDLATADRIRRFALAAAERQVADSPAGRLAEATRRLRNAMARLGRGRLELTDAEIDALDQAEYERLRSQGLL